MHRGVGVARATIMGMHLPPRRIHLSDTDATGVAYAGRLVDIALQRLEEALAEAGLDVAAHVSAPAAPAVVHLSTDFHRPARLGERLAGSVTLVELGTTSVRFAIKLGTAVTVTAVLVWVDRQAGAAAPWPATTRRRLLRLKPASTTKRRAR